MKATNFKLFPTITIIILFSFLINGINSSKCGSDKLKLNLGVINVPNDSKRNLATEYTAIKIIVDYTSFKKPDSMSNDAYNKVKELIDETTKEFSKFLKIQHQDVILYENIIKTECDVDAIDNNYANFLKDNDLVIFPSFDYPLEEYVLAAAKACLVTSNTYRPCAGNLYINPNLSFDMENTDLYIKHLFLHEMTHIFIFHPTLLDYYGMLSYKIENKKIKDISVKSPKVLEKARKHFNCNSLKGLPLENQGGSGSAGFHWEQRFMLGDYMISSLYMDNVLSEITLALFEDSGFYKVDYDAAELFKFGKDKGCDFFNKNCINNGEVLFKDEFCMNKGEPMCSQSRTSKGECMVYNYSIYNISIPLQYQFFDDPYLGGYPYTDFCPISENDENITITTNNYLPTSCNSGLSELPLEYGEKIGKNSFCFISSLLPLSSNSEIKSKAICYEVECDDKNKQIIVHIGNNAIKCPTNGGIITVSEFKGEINCPKYVDICNFKNNKICNEMFDCIDRKDNKNNNKDKQMNSLLNDDDNLGKYIKINFCFIFLYLLFN
jgi:hypothetical protein